MEDEAKFSLANILNLNVDEDDEGVWKEFYIERDDSIIQVDKQPKKDKKKKENENKPMLIEIVDENSLNKITPIGFIMSSLNEKMNSVRKIIVDDGVLSKNTFYVFMKFEENEILWDELEDLSTLKELSKHKEKDVYTLRLKSFPQRVIFLNILISYINIVLLLWRVKTSPYNNE